MCLMCALYGNIEYTKRHLGLPQFWECDENGRFKESCCNYQIFVLEVNSIINDYFACAWHTSV